ncbi:MAG: O-antigen ligase family protein [Planctomycetaceae bacterium]|nr:O-antigen ligase family protein [Planctomycetaceae bacterium]
MSRPGSPQTVSHRVDSWAVILLGAFLSRFLVATEGTSDGHTLWIAQLWLLLAAARGWWHWRNGTTFGFRWNRIDFACGALVAAHLGSAGIVLATQGQKRAALNLFWEWSSLAATYLLLKEALNAPPGRRVFVMGTVLLAATLSSLGLWQQFVWYPQQSREVTEFFELHDKRELGAPLSPVERTRFDELLKSHGSAPLSLDEQGRAAFLSRVRDSREPIGRFALANSFATLLGISGILFLGISIDQGNGAGRRRSQVIGWLLVGLPILLCLILTKSRTAYLATAIGSAILLLQHWGGRWGWRRIFTISAVAVVCMATLLGVLSVAGGIDKEVLTEAPKSLQYRLEYWQGAWGVIADHAWTGVGPGNFRQHYMQHKLAGSSEEVMDPHNLFLDVWANAGMVAFLALCGIVAFSVWPRGETIDATEPQATVSPFTFALGMTVSAGLVFLEQLLLEGHTDLQVFGVWIGAVILIAFTRIWQWPFSTGGMACAALLSLWIGLLAAGGIAMPAISQLAILLILLRTQPTGETSTENVASRRSLVMMSVFGVAALGCLLTGLRPVAEASQLVALGRTEMFQNRRWKNAHENFSLAAKRDPWDPEPHLYLAELSHWLWEQSGKKDELDFQAAVESLKQSIERDPFAAKRYQLLGRWWAEHGQATSDANSFQRSVDAFDHAATLYPNFASLQAERALAHSQIDSQSAQPIAEFALQLDSLNRERGHTDKQLPKETVAELQRIAGPPEAP